MAGGEGRLMHGERLRRRRQRRVAGARVHEAQLPGLALLLGLLSPEGHLGSHYPLSLRYQCTLGTHTVPPSTVALVTLERRDDAVVATSGALGCPLVPLARTKEERLWDRPQHRVQAHVYPAVHRHRTVTANTSLTV